MTRSDKIEEMIREASTIQTFMELEPTDIADELARRLSMANVYIARSGKLLADAKELQNEAIAATYEKMGEKLVKIGATMAGKVLIANCSRESFLVDWYDRINRGLVHSADNLRTLISYAKENMRLTRYAGEVSNDDYEDVRASDWM